MAQAFLWVVSYDIVNNRRRRKVAKILEDYGTRRQKSVFEARLTPVLWRKMWLELARAIDEREDRIDAYRLCADCTGRMDSLGFAEPRGEDEEIYFV
jgi:CRISPR-associated protein Cas2